MPDRACLVLVERRGESAYNDFAGRFYHFPQKYLKLLSQPGAEFIYYDPKRPGEGEYFGYGNLGKVVEDRREARHYFVEIVDYHSFSNPVAFLDENGQQREKGETYNAQNAVRRVDADTLDAICLDGGVILSFRADAHLIRVLGEELIANERVGILELIKNAYDAGATHCLVKIEDIPNLPRLDSRARAVGPIITIEDDGRGMDRMTIEHGWLRPASTIKTNVKERLKKERLAAEQSGDVGIYDAFVSELKRQHGGRIPLGEKGVGRFATHRLGRHLRLTTKQTGQTFELVLEIDWDAFESVLSTAAAVDLDSVGVALRRQPPSRDYGNRDSGTRLLIYGGKPGFTPTRDDLEELWDSVAMLKSPYHGAKNFDVTLEIPQLANTFDKPLLERFDAQFDFSAIVNSDGIADLELKFLPPSHVPLSSDDWQDSAFDLRKMDDPVNPYWAGADGTLRKPACGEFFVGIKAWYRRTPWVEGPDARRFLQYLDRYGGVSVYRDGLNILPASWGTSHDWLQLSTRHIKKGTNISYYAMIGACEVTQNANLAIVDKTDRQGLLENQAFKDLAQLVRRCVLIIENHYKAKRDSYETVHEGVVRDPATLARVTSESVGVLTKIRKAYDFSQDELALFPDLHDSASKSARILNLTSSLKNLQKSLKAMEDVQEMLTEQAGFGLAVAVSVHEIAKIAGNFYNGVVAMLQQDRPSRTTLEGLRDTSESLKSELSRFGPLRAIRNERPVTFRVSRAVNFVTGIFARVFAQDGIELRTELDDDIAVYARYGAFNQILNNLFDNSVYWLRQSSVSERVVMVKLETRRRRLVVADSGPGIDPAIRPYLFKPGYSLRVPPSGLGLYIASHYLAGFAASIHEAPLDEYQTGLLGAHFVIDLSRTPSSKEQSI